MLIDIVLYGTLEQRFGRYHKFDIDNPAEAVHALAANFPGFEQAIIKLPYGLRFLRDDKDLELVGDMLAPCDRNTTLRIVPMIAGAGSNNPLVNIIEGIAFIVLSFYLPGSQGAFYEFMHVSMKAIAVYVGVSLILTGISQLLMTPPEEERDKGPGSYLFNGPVNVTREGTPVAIGYGRLMVGSIVVSGGLYGDLITLTDETDWPNILDKDDLWEKLIHIPAYADQ